MYHTYTIFMVDVFTFAWLFAVESWVDSYLIQTDNGKRSLQLYATNTTTIALSLSVPMPMQHTRAHSVNIKQ